MIHVSPPGICPVSDKMNYTERTLCVLKFEDLDTKAKLRFHTALVFPKFKSMLHCITFWDMSWTQLAWNSLRTEFICTYSTPPLKSWWQSFVHDDAQFLVWTCCPATSGDSIKLQVLDQVSRWLMVALYWAFRSKRGINLHIWHVKTRKSFP